MEPLEIIGTPLTLWVAPPGTSVPAITEEPQGDWFKLGSNGNINYDEEGVTVTHEQNLEPWRGAGSTGPVKVFRTEEELMIAATLVDLSPEQYAKVLNDVSVVETAADASSPGTSSIGLSQGPDVAVFALLARGASPAHADLSAQYEVKRCYQGENPEPVFNKGDDPAGLAIQFVALEDLQASNRRERFGRLVIGTEPAAE